MKLMRINHRNGNYEVRFESLQDAFQRLPEDRRVITDSNVAACYPELLRDAAQVAQVEPGERAKSVPVFGELLSWLAQSGASRKTTVCAFGGGVVGDLAGFVAASYMRGVPFYQIPTTLLAQVDSSVGGKVAVDLPEGKNLAGAFYPPIGVSIAVEALESMPERQFANGMAEVWKCGFIMDRELVALLATERWHARHPSLPDVIARCVGHKARIVETDEHDRTGTRAILNFGHTVGHALERVAGYGTILHGEAVSIGMAAEARLGELIGETRAGVADIVSQHLTLHGLPVTHASLNRGDLLVEAMRADKKATDGNLAFSLLTDIGRCKLVERVPEHAVWEALRQA